MCVVAFLLSSLSDLCLCLSGVVCVTSIRIRFTTTRKTGSSPFRLLTRLFLRIEYLDYLPDIALEGISLMWPTDDASISNGSRRKQGFLLVIAMVEMNKRC